MMEGQGKSSIATTINQGPIQDSETKFDFTVQGFKITADFLGKQTIFQRYVNFQNSPGKFKWVMEWITEHLFKYDNKTGL